MMPTEIWALRIVGSEDLLVPMDEDTGDEFLAYPSESSARDASFSQQNKYGVETEPVRLK